MNPTTEEKIIHIKVSPTIIIEGNLTIPSDAQGLVLFAHGSGSSRHSPRNRFVAGELNRVRLGTLLLDLLTTEEEAVDRRTRSLRFDIGLLAERVTAAIDWLTKNEDTHGLNIGLFGASTGAAAALASAASRPSLISAVVSRGGRPDLAMKALSNVQAPTLFIVGGNDEPVIEYNEQAIVHLAGKKQLEIVPGATHLFEEPGKLEEVARLAQNWFIRHLSTAQV